MPFLSSRRPVRVGLIGVTLIAAATGFATPALARPAAASKGVSPIPDAGTPQLVKTSKEENVRQLVQCGSKMYAVGQFSTIKQGGKNYTRNNIFSFSATKPYAVSGLEIGTNGDVNTIAFTKKNGCADAYLGGSFTKVHGAAVKNIAEVSTSTGAVVKSFGSNADAQVETLAGYSGHLIAGGYFKSVNDSGTDPYLVSLSPTTGKDDGFVHLGISGRVPNGPTKVYNQQLSHSGNLLLVEGNFTSVGGQPRQQIFMLNLSGSKAKVTGWTSSEFSQHCVPKESFYVRDAAWSPSDSTVYISDTGLFPLTWNRKFPLTGLCDAAAAFPARQRAVSHKWINYMGCDSLYSVAADSSTVYIGGHQRWSQNQNGCNKRGPGATVFDPGLQGLNPSTGHLKLNSSGSPIYSMSRANADDMLVTRAGLWIASSNRLGSDKCGGVGGHSGICFLPYR